MNNHEQTIDKYEFIQRLYSAISSIDDRSDSSSGMIDVATDQAIEPLITPLLQQQVINTEHDPIFPTMSILLKQQLLEQNLTLSNDFFKLVKLIDKLFDYLLIDKHLERDIKNLISHIRIPFFKLALNDKTLFTDTSHPARLLFNDMLKVGLMWSTRDPKTFMIKEQLEIIIQQIMSTSSNQDINNVFLCAEKQFNLFSSGLLKRIEIFEKRVKESEEGKARAESAKTSAKEILSKVTCKRDIPLFVLNIFHQAWELVITLELLKGNNLEQGEALLTAKQLLVSLQPISNKDELENHRVIQSQLLDKLKRGLIKVAYPYNQIDNFFQQLNKHYEDILSQAEITVKKELTEKIIRLKPASSLDNAPMNDVVEDNKLTSTTTLTEDKLNQWVDKVFSELPNDSQNSMTNNTESVEKKTSSNQKPGTILQKSQWYELMFEQQYIRAKFSSYIQQNDKYIFVGGSGNKIAELSSSELNQLFHDKKIAALDTSAAFDKAYHLVTDEFISAHLKIEKENFERAQQQAQKIKDDKIKEKQIAKIERNLEQAELLEKKKIAQREKEEARRKSELALKESQPAINVSQLTEHEHNHIIKNISNLALGTWVELELQGEIKDCRLAAKIASSEKFIFVDRNDTKVMQCVEQELVDMYRSGQLKFKQKVDLFVEALPTVISSMRNLKSDN